MKKKNPFCTVLREKKGIKYEYVVKRKNDKYKET